MEYNAIIKLGNKFKRELRANKKKGFFDWQYAEYDDNEVTFEFYWNEIKPDNIYWIMSFMKSNEKLSPILSGGQHDIATGYQIVLKFTVKSKITFY